MAKRIGLAIDSLAGGGAEKIVLTLAREFKRLGHEPHLLVLSPHCDYTLPQDIPVHFCFTKGQRHIDGLFVQHRSVKRIKDWIATLSDHLGQFDVFFSNLDRTNLLLTQAKVSPLFCVIHNAIEEELRREMKLGPLAYFGMWRAKKALSGQRLITVSKGIEQDIIKQKRIKPMSMQTIYNPFDIESIRESASLPNVQIPKGDYIIHVGRVAKQKRHDVLFSALAKMQIKLPLVLLCNNPKKALKLAAKYGVADRVICPGFQDNPFSWIKHARLLVLSSDYEGFGNVIMESLICGTPVVSTDCPFGPNEILTQDCAQFLVPRRDPQALAIKMEQALNEYPLIADTEIFKQVDIEYSATQYLKLIP
ncbi:glycosyltransferase [Shewanella glacialimarina]|jgi:glycosyltransferase involved in cell wall biosynthesis|uniref:glycosyltransferase n=1 Tax=Shewanella glacialimarina TaxID=2590884 RepID=UPI001CF7F03C|nr:glycosyltransferase [Shewanella glacialimarina]UCX06387.1 glycosyltransferase [Shewanella glacialimarina]